MRLVVVPPYNTGILLSSGANVEGSVTINGVIHKVWLPYQPVPSVHIADQRLHYFNVYGIDSATPNRITIDQSEFSIKIWDFVEITDWINEHCKQYVLLITNSSYMWEFYFQAGCDLDAIREWWHKLRKSNFIKFEFPYKYFGNSKNIIHEWCKGNTKKRWNIVEDKSDLFVYFEDAEEAIHAKLEIDVIFQS